MTRQFLEHLLSMLASAKTSFTRRLQGWQITLLLRTILWTVKPFRTAKHGRPIHLENFDGGGASVLFSADKPKQFKKTNFYATTSPRSSLLFEHFINRIKVEKL